jgi:hypothetical protein
MLHRSVRLIPVFAAAFLNAAPAQAALSTSVEPRKPVIQHTRPSVPNRPFLANHEGQYEYAKSKIPDGLDLKPQQVMALVSNMFIFYELPPLEGQKAWKSAADAAIALAQASMAKFSSLSCLVRMRDTARPPVLVVSEQAWDDAHIREPVRNRRDFVLDPSNGIYTTHSQADYRPLPPLLLAPNSRWRSTLGSRTLSACPSAF